MLIQNDYHEKLSKITNKIINKNINLGELKNVLSDLKSLYSEVSGLDKNDASYELDIHHHTGKAVGPKWAELCVDDIIRTQKFIRGTYLAIKERLANQKYRPINLLYVGTGPFATLVMPLTTIFSPEELQLILVEINPISAECLKKTIHNFGVSKYVIQIITEDAAQLKLKNPENVDILLLECLQNALVKEQQVAITYNILPQLNSDTVLLPKEIKLDLCLINAKKHTNYLMSIDEVNPDYYISKNNIFLLNKEQVLANKDNNLEFSEVHTFLTEDDKRAYDRIAISTEICVFDDERLEPNQTSLTMMYRINEMNNVKNFNQIITQYQVSDEPGFIVKWV